MRKRHEAIWSPDELLTGEVWLLVLTNVDGALVTYVAPMTVSAGRAVVGAAVAAPAVETGAAIAMALRTVASPVRRIPVVFMSNLPFHLCRGTCRF
jgi:hypothetical protein